MAIVDRVVHTISSYLFTLLHVCCSEASKPALPPTNYRTLKCHVTPAGRRFKLGNSDHVTADLAAAPSSIQTRGTYHWREIYHHRFLRLSPKPANPQLQRRRLSRATQSCLTGTVR